MYPLQMTTVESVKALTVAVGWSLICFLGQGLVIGLVVAGVLRLLQSRSASSRYTVACLGLLVMAACPFWTAVRFLPDAERSSTERPRIENERFLEPAIDRTPEGGTIPASFETRSGAESQASALVSKETREAGWRERIEPVLPAIVAIWLAGVMLMTLRLLAGFLEARSLIHRDVSPLPDELRSLVDRLMERSGLRRSVQWLMSQRVETPAVVGWLRPTVLIPLQAMASLTLRQLEAILAHELAHIRRHDYVVNFVQVVIETVLFFHPATWWVSKRIRIERENCCDDWAAEFCGDRALVARALFVLEEARGNAALALAANGGTLKDRVRRLLVKEPPNARRPDVGWLGGGVLLGLITILAALWFGGVTEAREDASAKPAALGRVLDELGKPVSGARVRLYYREDRWQRANPMIEEVQAGPDGKFQFKSPLKPRASEQTSNVPPYLIVADHPGKAVGWRIVPLKATTFEDDVILTPPTSRTITVVDADGKPVSGAKVVVNILGDPSLPLASFRSVLELWPNDGPLVKFTDQDGLATFDQFPKTESSIVASKSGQARTYAFGNQNKIRLTPSASLSGHVTGPNGEPVAGVKVVVHADSMWDFEYVRTDKRGVYRFDDLPARGWDMGAWGAGTTGNGKYELWIDDDRVGGDIDRLVLEPGMQKTQDIHASAAEKIQVSVIEEDTRKPVAGVRVQGSGEGSQGYERFNRYTDAQGLATFHGTPGTYQFFISQIPDGVYVKGEFGKPPGESGTVNLRQGEASTTLTMWPIQGGLVDVEGYSKLPSGEPARGVLVNASAYGCQTSGNKNFYPDHKTDDQGHFVLEGLPAGERIAVYGRTTDRKFAGVVTFQSPSKQDPMFRMELPLRKTVEVEKVFRDRDERAIKSKEFHVFPKTGNDVFSFARWSVKSDSEGRAKFDGVVPGMSYQVQQQFSGLVGFGYTREVNVKNPIFDEVLVLAPEDGAK